MDYGEPHTLWLALGLLDGDWEVDVAQLRFPSCQVRSATAHLVLELVRGAAVWLFAQVFTESRAKMHGSVAGLPEHTQYGLSAGVGRAAGAEPLPAGRRWTRALRRAASSGAAGRWTRPRRRRRSQQRRHQPWWQISLV